MGFANVLSELVSNSLLTEIGIILIFATILAFVVRMFKQPLVPAYILAGLILGPLGLGIIKDSESIRTLSEFGIAFLLFAVGLEIDVKKLKEIGLTASLGGLLQVAFVFFAGFYIALRLGFAQFEAIVLGFVLAFSSTMVVIKLLSDTEQLDTLHGRIVLGILLVQDLIIILVLSILSNGTQISTSLVFAALLRGLILFITAFLAGKYIFPHIFKFAARAKELLFLTSLTVLFIFAILAHFLNFSVAIGAFIAGISLASLPYHHDIVGRVNPLKSFFATIFFASLGMQLTAISSTFMIKALYLILAVIILKPIIIYIIVTLFGYEKRTSFFSGLSLGQTSEFSLILIVMPFIMGVISQEVFSIVILITIVTMILTSYLIEFQYPIYLFFSPVLSFIEKLAPKRKRESLEYTPKSHKIDVILIGKHRMGSIFFEALSKLKKKVMIIDHNPDVIRKLLEGKIPCIYGNMSNREVLDKIKTRNLKTIISTVPSLQDNLYLIKYIKDKNKKTNVILTANHIHEARLLYNKGADYVILPHILSGEKVATMIRKSLKNKKYFQNTKKDHIKHLDE
ncbi:cation:proton antiporter [archaeon]|nr:cation:proton antiporter [archaeon]